MSILPNHSPAVVQDCPEITRIPRQADQLAWIHDGNDPEDYPGPGWDADRFEPSVHAEAQEAGYHRGYLLDWSAMPHPDLDSLGQICFMLGKVEGVRDRQADDIADAEYRREMADAAFAQVDHHPDEAIRAIGVIAARSERGAR